MLPPRAAVDGEVSPDAELEPVEPAPVEEPVEPAPVEPAPDADEPVDPVEPDADVEPVEPELDPEPMLEPLPLPMRAFFSTKVPPLAPPLADALLVSLLLVLELVLDPSPRCRQPVAVTLPAVSDDDLPVDVWAPPWGVVDVGDCAAASAPQNATLLLSVIAHCQ